MDLTDELLVQADCVVFTTNHSCFNIEHIVAKSSLVVDLRNAVKTVHIESDKVLSCDFLPKCRMGYFRFVNKGVVSM